jgi:hypothetical protein
LVDLVPITKQILFQRQDLQTFEERAEMPNGSQVADPTLSQRYALYFVQIVDLGPDLVEAYKLDDDLFALLDGLEIGLSVVFYLMYLSGPYLLHSRISLLLIFTLTAF